MTKSNLDMLEAVRGMLASLIADNMQQHIEEKWYRGLLEAQGAVQVSIQQLNRLEGTESPLKHTRGKTRRWDINPEMLNSNGSGRITSKDENPDGEEA